MDLSVVKAADADPTSSVEAGLVALRAITEDRARFYRATTRDLMADLGLDVAHVILTALETAAQNDAALARVMSLLSPSQGGIDLSHPGTQAMLDQLQENSVLSAEHVSALKALAVEKVYPFANVTHAQLVKARALT